MNYKHGQSKKGNKTYTTWVNIRTRCTNKNYRDFHLYGGRGITVCEEWGDFSTFLSDMGESPDGGSIDRIDNTKGYSKDNCRWATPKEQANNRRSCLLITFEGKTQNLKQWAEEFGVCYKLVHCRLKRGHSMEEALSKTNLQRKK